MSDKFNRQIGVGIRLDFKRKNHRKCIEHFRHRKPPFAFPGPDLRTDVIKKRNAPASFAGKAAIVQFAGEPEIEARIIDKTDRLRSMLLNPLNGTAAKLLELRKVFQNFDQADDGGFRHIVKNLRSGCCQGRSAESSYFQIGSTAQKSFYSQRRLLIARMFTDDQQKIGRSVRRCRKINRVGHKNTAESGQTGPDLLGNRNRNFKRRSSEPPIDLRIERFLDTFKKSRKLQLQRLVPLDWNLLAIQLKPIFPDQMSALVHEIERKIGGRLEDADFTEFFLADTAGIEIGDTSVFKKDPRIRDILGRRQNIYTDAIDPLDRRFHQLQKDTDIVNHQIEDDTDFGPAQLKRREPIGGNVTRLIDRLLEKCHDRIEMFDMPDLDDPGFLFRSRKNLFGLLKTTAKRLFDQQMATGFEQRNRYFAMKIGWDNDADGIAFLRHFLQR